MPNDAPQVDVPALNVARYINRRWYEIKDAGSGCTFYDWWHLWSHEGRTGTRRQGCRSNSCLKSRWTWGAKWCTVDVLSIWPSFLPNRLVRRNKSYDEGFVDMLPSSTDNLLRSVTNSMILKTFKRAGCRLSVHEVRQTKPPVVEVPWAANARRRMNSVMIWSVWKGRQLETNHSWLSATRTVRRKSSMGLPLPFYAPIAWRCQTAPIDEFLGGGTSREWKGDDYASEEGSNGPRRQLVRLRIWSHRRWRWNHDSRLRTNQMSTKRRTVVIVPTITILVTMNSVAVGQVEKGHVNTKPTIREYHARTGRNMVPPLYAPIKHEI